MKRVNWIGAPEFFNLNAACRFIVDAFGWHVYLVGSAMQRRDHRDVDVRCMLDDDEFDRLFPGGGGLVAIEGYETLVRCAPLPHEDES